MNDFLYHKQQVRCAFLSSSTNKLLKVHHRDFNANSNLLLLLIILFCSAKKCENEEKIALNKKSLFVRSFDFYQLFELFNRTFDVIMYNLNE